MRKYIQSKLHHPASAMQEGTVHMTPAQEKAFKREGLRVVLGGIMIHFVYISQIFNLFSCLGTRNILPLGRNLCVRCLIFKIVQ